MQAAFAKGRTDCRRAPALRKWGAVAGVTIAKIKEFAPYALLELVMPGGSLMAILLWIHRRQKSRAVQS